jgi:hypothetical protein
MACKLLSTEYAWSPSNSSGAVPEPIFHVHGAQNVWIVWNFEIDSISVSQYFLIRLTLTTLSWKRNWLLLGRQLLVAHYSSLDMYALHKRLDSKFAYIYFPKHAAYIIQFREMVSINEWNHYSHFQRNCHFGGGISKGPLSLELEYTYSTDTDLWWINSEIRTTSKICPTVHALTRGAHTYIQTALQGPFSYPGGVEHV